MNTVSYWLELPSSSTLAGRAGEAALSLRPDDFHHFRQTFPFSASNRTIPRFLSTKQESDRAGKSCNVWKNWIHVKSKPKGMIYRQLSRYKHLGGLVPVSWLGVQLRYKASKLWIFTLLITSSVHLAILFILLVNLQLVGSTTKGMLALWFEKWS